MQDADFEDAQNIFRRIEAKRLIITHIEEDWGKSYDDYLEIEKGHQNVSFAYDGLSIIL